MGPNATAYPKRFGKYMVTEEILRLSCWEQSLICLFSNQKPIPNSWALSELSLRWWKDNSCLPTPISAVREGGGCRSCPRPEPGSQQGKGAWAAGEQGLPHTLWPADHCSLPLTDNTLLSHTHFIHSSQPDFERVPLDTLIPLHRKLENSRVYSLTANHHYSLRKNP